MFEQTRIGARALYALVLVALSAVLLTLAPLPIAHAQESSTATPIDVVILLDDSGSTATCVPWLAGEQPRTAGCLPSQVPPGDPLALRYSAARLLVHLAGDSDRIAMLRFDATVEPVGSGTLQPVGGPDSRRALVEAMQPPTDYSQRAYTRIDLALQRAAEILAERDEPERAAYVLLLTDGEPTQPASTPPQAASVRQTMERLRQIGAVVEPVALCNQGCPGSFLTEHVAPPREAATPPDLLRAFAALFAQMKPDLHIVERRNADGNLEWFTRTAHGVEQLTVVTARGDFVALRRDDTPTSPDTRLEDANIAVHVLESSALPAGRWTVQAQQESGFVVARTRTYPELIHPPPPAPGSAAPRLVPAGKPALIVARAAGPAGGEPLLLDSTTPLLPFSLDSAQRWALVAPDQADIALQVGADTQPLQIRRAFRLEPRPGLPTLQAQPPACLAGDACALRVEFAAPPGDTPLQDVQAAVAVADVTSGEEVPIYQAAMACEGRACSDEGFAPQSGRAYVIRYTAQATSQGARFGDWADTQMRGTPAAAIDSARLDFGEVPFSPAPGFRLDTSTSLGVQFSERVFPLAASIASSDCAGIAASASAPQRQPDGSYSVAVHLRSDTPPPPGTTCTGTLEVSGTSDEQQVQPDTPLSWELVVPPVSWSLLGVVRGDDVAGELLLNDIVVTGDRARATLLVRYTGAPPFSLALAGVQATSDEGNRSLSRDDLELLAVAPEALPDQPGVYRVPLTLAARRTLPHHPLSGAWYSGQLELTIPGLPQQDTHTIGVRFHSPGWFQRHILPPLQAFYGWWWPGALTIPLSIVVPLLALFVFLGMRNTRAATEQMHATPPPSSDSDLPAAPPPPATSPRPTPGRAPGRGAGRAPGQRTAAPGRAPAAARPPAPPGTTRRPGAAPGHAPAAPAPPASSQSGPTTRRVPGSSRAPGRS